MAEQLGSTMDGHTYTKPSGHVSESRKAPSDKLKANQEIFNGSAAKIVEPTRGRIWVCDVSLPTPVRSLADRQLCFKYMRNRASWDRHSVSLIRPSVFAELTR